MKPKRDEPKPCPWCGEEPSVYAIFSGSRIAVECRNDKCLVNPSYWEKTRSAAIRAWNRRKP